MDATNRNVLVTPRFFDDEARAALEAAGCRAVVHEPPGQNDSVYTEDELIALLQGMQGWIVGNARVSRRLLEAAPELRILARRGVGIERIDASAAAELGKVITIAAGGNAPSVADQTIGMMIGIGRHFHAMREGVKAGQWKPQVGVELYRSTVGLLGFGRIAQGVARRLAGFEVRVLVCSPRANPDVVAAMGASLVDLPTLLRESDFLSLHVPLNDETRRIIDAAALAAMKPGAFLVNTARGGLVDEPALLAALCGGRLGGAALDVFQGETDPAAKALAEELIALPNVLATPHSGSSTRQALARSNLLACEAVIAVLDGGAPASDCVAVDGRTASRHSPEEARG